MATPTIPKFSNFIKPTSAPPTSSNSENQELSEKKRLYIDIPSGSDLYSKYEPIPKRSKTKEKEAEYYDLERKHKEKKQKEKNKSKKKHKKRIDDLRDLNDDELDLKFDWTNSKKNVTSPGPLHTSNIATNRSDIFTIHEIADRRVSQYGIHKLDRPEYNQSFFGVLGAPIDLRFQWSPDHRSFEVRHIRDSLESVNKKSKSEGRYYSKKNKQIQKIASSSIQRPKPSKTIPEGYKNFGDDIIKLTFNDDVVDQEEKQISEQEQLEMQFLRESRIINERLLNNPTDISTWLQLVSLQDQFSSLVSGNYGKKSENVFHSTSNSTKLVLEKKIEIFNHALEKNPGNEILLIGKMQCIEILYEPAKVNQIWSEIVASFPASPQLWASYLQFTQSNFSSFSIDRYRNVSQYAVRFLNRSKNKFKIGSVEHIQIESFIAEFIIKLAKIEFQAGYTEKAIAIFQSLIEINYFAPDMIVNMHQQNQQKINEMCSKSHQIDDPRLAEQISIVNSSFRDNLIKSFQLFWDQEVPRFGEKDAIGWKQSWINNDALKPSIVPYNPFDNSPNDTAQNGEHDLPIDDSEELMKSGKQSFESVKNDENQFNIAYSTMDDTQINPTQIAYEVSGQFQNGKSKFETWLSLEKDTEITQFLPIRTTQIVDQDNNLESSANFDMDSVVLFEDLTNYLVYFSYDSIRVSLLDSFFDLMGVHLPFRKSTNSLAYQNKDLELEEPSSILEFLEKVKFPAVCSLTANEAEGSTNPWVESRRRVIKTPVFYDFLDYWIEKDLLELQNENPKKLLLSHAIDQLCKLKKIHPFFDYSNVLKASKIHIFGKNAAKSLLQEEPSNLTLWSAYAKSEMLLAFSQIVSNPKSYQQHLKESKKVFNNSIMVHAENPNVSVLVYQYSLLELIHEHDFGKVISILMSIPQAKFDPSSLSSPSKPLHIEEIIRARQEYERKFGNFVAGIQMLVDVASGTLKVAPNVHVAISFDTQMLQNLFSSLDVFFNLVNCCALFEALSNSISSFNAVYETAKSALRRWATQTQNADQMKMHFSELTGIQACLMWYIERLQMNQVNFLLIEHHNMNQAVPSRVIEDILMEGLSQFPTNKFMISAYTLIASKSQLLAKVRLFFDSKINDKSTEQISKLVLWLLAARSETKQGAYNRIRRLLESSLQASSSLISNIKLYQSLSLWRFYFEFELHFGKLKNAKGILFRAIRACPWAKSLWLSIISQMGSKLKDSEVSDLIQLMKTKQIRIRCEISS